VEYSYADGKLNRVPALAAEMVRLKVEVIVTGGSAATRPAKEATATIPIVMAQDTDPVGNGFVASLARPGGNITGLSIVAPELGGKQLELLKETVPKLVRVVVPSNPDEASYAQLRKETELAAKALKIQTQFLDARGPKDVESAFREAIKRRADAVLVPTMPIVAAQRAQIAALAVENRLPAMYGQPEYVDLGGLMFYGASINDLFRRAATYVDKILKGTKPADLAVEQPTKFELIINLKAAKQIGLRIPPNVLARADRVIK
jgi:putative tryptophan/tyrosine transport system substrate-binding protein